jgi:hypothetical protein
MRPSVITSQDPWPSSAPTLSTEIEISGVVESKPAVHFTQAEISVAAGASRAALNAVGMNQSLDGYVDHRVFSPSLALFRHFIEQVRGLAGSVYGRRMYEVTRYWDEDQTEMSG